MPDKDRVSTDPTRGSETEVDRGDVTPPHGDELRSEETFGRTDRYANQDDPEAEGPALAHETLISEEELNADGTRRRMQQLDDAAADDARMATRKREHGAD